LVPRRIGTLGEGATKFFRPLALFLLGVVTFGSWALSSAVGSAPDDDYHLTSIWCSSFAGDVCEVDPNGEGVYIPEALREAIYCYYHNPEQSAGCQPFLDGTDPRPDVAFAHNNPHRNLYPDSYYQVQHLLKTENIEATALSIRFVNLSLFLVVGFALFFALPVRLRSAWIWMWALGLVPMGMFIIPSSNPSSWALTAVAAGWMSLLGYLETKGPHAWVLGSLYLAMAVIALSARVDAVLYLGLASLIAVWQSDTRGTELLKKTWIGLVGVVFVVFQLIRNPANLERVVEGIGQRSDRIDEPLPWVRSGEAVAQGFDWSLFWNNALEIPGLWLGVFGGFPWGTLGWLDTAIPQSVVFLVMLPLLGVLFLALREADPKKLIALAISVFAVWALPMYLLQLGGFRVGEEVQPRYLIPLMMVLLGTLVLNKSGLPVITDTRRVWLIIVCLSVANSIALHTNIRRYTTGTRVQGFNLDSPREWWWPFFPDFFGPNVLWLVGTLAFGALLWALLVRVVPLLPLQKLETHHRSKAKEELSP
jgi:hypothetical protein